MHWHCYGASYVQPFSSLQLRNRPLDLGKNMEAHILFGEARWLEMLERLKLTARNLQLVVRPTSGWLAVYQL
jgi:hypothetical protein